ncbi:MAG: hypothetical protein BWX77_00792 [Bacteroidetes bacterium ADurb.Bin090]|nr:MAG: hypothetical protein BWX77_00792 [Bacteroidetes bacterium ADurb.Bin090]
MQDGLVALLLVDKDFAQQFARFYLVSQFYSHLSEVGIDRKVFAVAHNDGSVHTRYHKDFTDGTLKNGSGRSSCPGLDIDALAVGLHVFEFLKFLLAKVHDDGSRFVQGEGEFAFVVAKVV